MGLRLNGVFLACLSMCLSMCRSSVFLLAACGLLLPACGGGGGGSGEGGSGGGGGGGGSLASSTFSDIHIEGLRYETQTQSGMTDAAGTYSYFPGETITFYIGETLLGTLTAQANLNLHLVSGGVVLPLTNADAQSALRTRSFSRFVNIAMLLQFVDEDGDIDNGIQVPSDLHSLLTPNTLDLSLIWRDFRASLALRRMRRDGLVQGLWGGVGRPFPFTAVVLERQYQALGVNHRFCREASRSEDTDGIAPVEVLVTMSYDEPFGYLSGSETHLMGMSNYERATVISHGAGGAELSRQFLDNTMTQTSEVQYTYDPNGNLIGRLSIALGAPATSRRVTNAFDDLDFQIRTSIDDDNDGNPNYIGEVVYGPDGETTSAIERNDPEDDGTYTVAYIQYDNAGREILRRFDADDNPATSDDVTTHIFQANGNPSTTTIDLGEDGIIDELETWNYNGSTLQNRLIEYDTTGDGVRDSQILTDYDAIGRPVLFQIDDNRDGILDAYTTWTYPPAGGIITVADSDADGNINSRTTVDPSGLRTTELDLDDDGTMESIMRYDDQGRLASTETDANDDGIIDITVERAYDMNSRVSRETTYDGASMLPSRVETFAYESQGRIAHREVDSDADGTPDEIYDWWYVQNASGGTVTHEDTDDDGIANNLATTHLDTWGQLRQTIIDIGNDGAFESVRTTVNEPGTWAAILPHAFAGP